MFFLNIFYLILGNPLDHPLPLNSDFWEKKSSYYSHGGEQIENESSQHAESDSSSIEQIVVERLKIESIKLAKKDQRLEDQLMLIAPAVDQVKRKWENIDEELDNLNFTALEWEIENELPELNDRSWRRGRQRGRGARGLPAFLSNAVKLFDLKQVVKELETSVMTSVSCSACKAGSFIFKLSSILCLIVK